MSRNLALSDIADIFNGKTPSKNDQRINGYPVLKIKDTDSTGNFKGKFESFVDVEFSEKYQEKKLRTGDFLVLNAAHNSSHVGSKVFFAKNDLNAPLITGEWLVIRANSSLVDSGYLRHYLSSDLAKKQFERLVKGIHLYPKDVGRLKLELPNIEEQRRIAAILDKAEALRTKRREAIDKLDQLLQSVFLEMFGDPVSNPKKFTVRNLTDFYFSPKEGTRCGPFGSALKKSDITEDGVPLWNMDNISLKGEMIAPFSAYVSSEKANDLSSYSVEDGDILISRAGTVGKMCVARGFNKKSLITTNLIRLRFNKNLIPEFFIYLMIYNKGKIGRLQVGPDGAFTHMSTGILDSISFPYPPLSLQEKWANIRNSIISKKKISLYQLESIDKFQKALSVDLFK